MPPMFDAHDMVMIVRRMIAYWLIILLVAAIVIFIVRARR
jgi:hypothetical protein